MAARPLILPVDPAGIPDDLKRLPQWVLWTLEPRGDEWTKEPWQLTGRHASATDRSTWTTFDAAIAGHQSGKCDGVGFVLSPDIRIFCVDLDKVRDPATGELTDLARQWMELGTFTELSPSGSGLHLWFSGELPDDPHRTGSGRRAGGGSQPNRVEIYASGRFMTVTGQQPEAAR